MQSPELMLGILCGTSLLVFLWIIIIHVRVNKLKKEIERLKKIAAE